MDGYDSARYNHHPITRRDGVYYDSSHNTLLAERGLADSTLANISMIRVQEPTLLPPLPYETWTFEPGVDTSSGQDGFTLRRSNLGGSGFAPLFDSPGRKGFRVNVPRGGSQTFMVKEEKARDPRTSGRYVEFFRRSPRIDLRFLSNNTGNDGFRHFFLNTANLLPEGASGIDLGYWYEEDNPTGLKWHEFKLTWPGGPPDGDEQTFHFSWKQRCHMELDTGIDSEYVLEVTESPGAVLPPDSTHGFSCKLKKLGRPRQRIELEISRGILGTQRQPADVDHIWENMRWAAIVWSASYVYGFLDRSINDRLGVVPYTPEFAALGPY